MATKLGEILVEGGLLDEDQLKRALRAQLVYGGHLGTCLIELGYLEEATLGKILARTFGVEYATPELFRAVPSSVIAVLPSKLVEKHQVIPLRVIDKLFHVAMVNPRDYAALDEVSFASGMRLQPWVAPEIRIFEAMERLYGIPRRQRFIAICRGLDGARDADHRVLPDGPLPPAVGDTSYRSVVSAGAKATQEPAPEEASPAAETLGDPDLDVVYGRTWRDVVGEFLEPEDDANASGPPAAPREAAIGSVLPALDVDAGLRHVAGRLCRAETRDEAADAVLDFAALHLRRCVLFVVRSALARLWGTRGYPENTCASERIRFPVTAEPLFQLLGGEDHYQGPLPAEPGHRRLFLALGVEPPAEVLLLPVYLEDRLVALLCGDAGAAASLPTDAEAFRRLARKFSLALNVLVFKKKLQVA